MSQLYHFDSRNPPPTTINKNLHFKIFKPVSSKYTALSYEYKDFEFMFCIKNTLEAQAKTNIGPKGISEKGADFLFLLSPSRWANVLCGRQRSRKENELIAYRARLMVLMKSHGQTEARNCDVPHDTGPNSTKRQLNQKAPFW